MAPQTAISKAVCYKTKNEQLWEKAVHFLFVATNCFYAGLPTDFCTITRFRTIDLYKNKKSSLLSCFWYSVGESNPYCKIENLEY